MQKADRLLAIEKIVGEAVVSTQEELMKRLSEAGIPCTQATLSRNLRQLGISRVADGKGGYKYSMPGSERSDNLGYVPNIVPVIREIIEANGMMVIKTFPGNASNTAFYIDGLRRYEIAGTIAGDDTILLIPRDGVTLQQVHSCLELILPGIHDQLKRRKGVAR